MIKAVFCKEQRQLIKFDVSELPTTTLVEFLKYTKEASMNDWMQFQLDWFIKYPDCPILVM